ncbi:MAG: DUF2490 domain-containing protein [Bacteroidota bacterium]
MKKYIVILLFLIFTDALYSQQVKVTNDFGFWSGINIEKKLPNGFKINFEQQVRLYSNARELDDYIVDFGGKYMINKNFRLRINLRYIYDQKRWKDAENNYRYYLDLLYKGKLTTKLRLHYRLRYQHEYVNLFTEYHSKKIHYSGIRNKIKAQLKLNEQNNIYVSGELFRLIETHREPYFNKIRFHIGDEFETKIGSFNFSAGYEQEINDSNPLTFFLIKTIYTLKL